VPKNLVATGAALDQIGGGKFHVDGLPTASPCFWCFTSRYCHTKPLKRNDSENARPCQGKPDTFRIYVM